MFHKSFPWYQRTACEDETESLEWAHHPWYTVPGIQNLWEFPEETLSQISSKKISKFPYVTYTNGWGKRKKKVRKRRFTEFFISAITLQILLNYFPLKPLKLIPSSRGTAISFTRPLLPPGLAGLEWIISQQKQPRLGSQPETQEQHFSRSNSFHLQQQWAALRKVPQQQSRSGHCLPLSLWSINSLH